MLQNYKYQHHKQQSLESNANFEYLIQIFDEFIPLLHYFKHSNHSSHADDLVQFSDSSYTHQSVVVAVYKQDVEGYDRYNVNYEPRLKV